MDINFGSLRFSGPRLSATRSSGWMFFHSRVGERKNEREREKERKERICSVIGQRTFARSTAAELVPVCVCLFVFLSAAAATWTPSGRPPAPSGCPACRAPGPGRRSGASAAGCRSRPQTRC